MIYTVTIPKWHPTSLNKLLSLHWARRTKAKQSDYDLVAWYCNEALVPKATGKRRIGLRLILGKGSRAPDPDNMLKVLLDALVACGRLVDDNRQYCELLPAEFERGERATVITLEDV